MKKHLRVSQWCNGCDFQTQMHEHTANERGRDRDKDRDKSKRKTVGGIQTSHELFSVCSIFLLIVNILYLLWVLTMIYYEIFVWKRNNLPPTYVVKPMSILSGFDVDVDASAAIPLLLLWCTLVVTQCLQFSFIWYLVDINVKHHPLNPIQASFFLLLLSYYYFILFFLPWIYKCTLMCVTWFNI